MRNLSRPFTIALVGLMTGRSAQALSRCNTILNQCSQTACFVSCTTGTGLQKEAELRQAVNDANSCKGVAGFSGRTISFNGPCTIDLMNTQSSANSVAICTAETAVPFKYAVCLSGDNVTIDGGNNVTLNYAGSVTCNAACDSCGPAPFVIRGNRNTVKNLTYQFFPEGLLVRTGDANLVENVKSPFYCDEAVTVGGPSTTPTNTIVRLGTFTGHSCSSRCSLGDAKSPCGANQPTCGFDKAIQLDSGTGTQVGLNRFNTPSQAVHMLKGTANISGNNAYGNPTTDISQSFTVEGGTATMDQNVLVNHKFGILAKGTGAIDATSNAFFDCYVNGLEARDSGKIRGFGNRFKSCGRSTTACSPGAVGATNSSASRVDLGGGDCNGQEVVPGHGTSLGQNTFCQGALIDLNNRTFTGAPTSCTGTQSTACMRAQNNCFENGPTVNPVGSVSTTGATTNCQCNFSPPP